MRKKDWMTEKWKRACQAGKANVNWKKQVIPAKNCEKSCIYKCALKVDKETRQRIFDGFYQLEKEGGNFKSTNRQNSYSYYLQPEDGIQI